MPSIVGIVSMNPPPLQEGFEAASKSALLQCVLRHRTQRAFVQTEQALRRIARAAKKERFEPVFGQALESCEDLLVHAEHTRIRGRLGEPRAT
ncbi:MAG TPA: hypothetical protein VFR86_00340 [Burkholderiaceae bacterium]|nr:hypothetical protein [Burkholderiaceae bacterium]